LIQRTQTMSSLLFKTLQEHGKDDSWSKTTLISEIASKDENERESGTSKIELPLELACLVYDIVGHPVHQIYRVKLPIHMIPLLRRIRISAENISKHLVCGWSTNLYSLTKQDIPLKFDLKAIQMAKPVLDYIMFAIGALFGKEHVFIDSNQPHILKYSTHDKHTGIRIHHDKCHVTANLMMSKSSEYSGGGYVYL